MDDSRSLAKRRKAQMIIEQILLIIAVVALVILFARGRNTPFGQIFNSMLRSPVDQMRSGTEQLRLN